MSKLKKITTKRLNTSKRVKIQRKGAIKLPNKRLLKNKNKGKCFIPKNKLITDNEKVINKQLKELEYLRNKEIRECNCEKNCNCFLNINISISCFKEPLLTNADINLLTNKINLLTNSKFIYFNNLKESIKNICIEKGLINLNELKLTAFINELIIMEKKQLLNKSFFLDKLIINVTDNRIYSIYYLISQYKEKLITKNMLDNFINELIKQIPKEEILCLFKIPNFENKKEFIKYLCDTYNLSNNMFSLLKIISQEVRNNKIDWNSENEKIIFKLNYY